MITLSGVYKLINFSEDSNKKIKLTRICDMLSKILDSTNCYTVCYFPNEKIIS